MIAVPIDSNIVNNEVKLRNIVAICLKLAKISAYNESSINSISDLLVQLQNPETSFENTEKIVSLLNNADVSSELIDNKQIKEILTKSIKEPKIYTKTSPIEYRKNWIYPNGN